MKENTKIFIFVQKLSHCIALLGFFFNCVIEVYCLVLNSDKKDTKLAYNFQNYANQLYLEPWQQTYNLADINEYANPNLEQEVQEDQLRSNENK